MLESRADAGKVNASETSDQRTDFQIDLPTRSGHLRSMLGGRAARSTMELTAVPEKRRTIKIDSEGASMQVLSWNGRGVPMGWRVLLTVAVTISFSGRTIAGEPRPITKADNVFAIYADNWGLGSSGDTKLIFCAWEDGDVVWSTDRIEGGPPYRTAKLRSGDVISTLDRMDRAGIFDISRLNGGEVIVDSVFTTILIRRNGKQLRMQSSHELYEAHGSTMHLEGIVPGREPRKRLQLLADKSADYLHYRMTWLELRLAAAALVPANGSDSTGSPKMRHGVLSWESVGN
jgi:hypothetical protein